MVTGKNRDEAFVQISEDLKQDPRVFKYDPRWMQIDPERLPGKLNEVRKRLNYDKCKLETEFYMDMLVIGIYPDLFFVPIKITSSFKENIQLCKEFLKPLKVLVIL